MDKSVSDVILESDNKLRATQEKQTALHVQKTNTAIKFLLLRYNHNQLLLIVREELLYFRQSKLHQI